MPIPVSYPGVYVQEVSSGVHTITGVATSITAFVGRTLRGPLDTDGPDGVVTVNGFPDFQRVYGGVWAGQPAELRGARLLPQRWRHGHHRPRLRGRRRPARRSRRCT